MINRIPHPPIVLKCSGRTIIHSIEKNGCQFAEALTDPAQPWLTPWMTSEEAREWKAIVIDSMQKAGWEMVK